MIYWNVEVMGSFILIVVFWLVNRQRMLISRIQIACQIMRIVMLKFRLINVDMIVNMVS